MLSTFVFYVALMLIFLVEQEKNKTHQANKNARIAHMKENPSLAMFHEIGNNQERADVTQSVVAQKGKRM